jgi:flavin-binding protein dodecin
LIHMGSIIGDSVYDVIELVGTSTKSWEEAVKTAIATADKRLTNMRIAEVVDLDTNLVDGKIRVYRARVKLSFKHEVEPETL